MRNLKFSFSDVDLMKWKKVPSTFNFLPRIVQVVHRIRIKSLNFELLNGKISFSGRFSWSLCCRGFKFLVRNACSSVSAQWMRFFKNTIKSWKSSSVIKFNKLSSFGFTFSSSSFIFNNGIIILFSLFSNILFKDEKILDRREKWSKFQKFK